MPATPTPSYNPFIPADRQQQYMAAQQQEALANALLQQGETPISTEGRSIGGVGYKISPLEGLAKMADILSGKDQQNTANAALANALSGGLGDGSNLASRLPPGMAQFAQAYPEEAAKVIMTASLADHRQGSSYYDLNAGKTITAPTEYQTNNPSVGDASSTPTNAPPPGNPAPNPQVSGPLPVAPPPGTNPSMNQSPVVVGSSTGIGANAATDALSPESNAAALAEVRPNGAPPIDAQRASMGYGAPAPVVPGSSQGGPAPPIPASALQPPAPPSAAPTGSNATLMRMPGEGQLAYEARLKPLAARDSAKATAIGTATGEAVKGAATIDSRIDNAMEQLNNARKANTYAVGGPGAETIKDPIAQQWNQYFPTKPDAQGKPIYSLDKQGNPILPAAVADAQYNNSMKIMLTQAIPAVVQASGGRIDIPLLNAIKEAENAPLSLSSEARSGILDRLEVALKQQQQNAHNQVSNLSGQPSQQAQAVVTHKWTPQGIVPVGQQ